MGAVIPRWVGPGLYKSSSWTSQGSKPLSSGGSVWISPSVPEPRFLPLLLSASHCGENQLVKPSKPWLHQDTFGHSKYDFRIGRLIFVNSKDFYLWSIICFSRIIFSQ